jgi:hypothetical protein
MFYVNNLIDINLRLIFLSNMRFLLFSEFKDKDGNKLPEYLDFLKIMESKNLIQIEVENNAIKCVLTPFGLKVSENGGWLAHLNKIEEEKELLEQKKRIIEKRKQWLSVTNIFSKIVER